MDTFAWLAMGHLVGDWLLQNDWMARGKRKRLITAAGMAHFAVYTLTILGALWVSRTRAQSTEVYLLVALVVFISHWLLDATNIVDYWMRVFQQTSSSMVRVMVDQSFHLLVLAGLVALAIAP